MKRLYPFLVLVFLFFTLLFSIGLTKRTQKYLSEAFGQPANITVDAKIILSPLSKPWRSLAQGGEEKGRMLADVIAEVAAVHPQYIRIDHLYDFYDVVSRENGKLKFDWSKLDQTVNDILRTGAKPFFSLSYMPSAIARDDIVSPPKSWDEWSLVVQRTIEHYSGRRQRNLSGIYYEVWNEPDLFGKWRLGCSLWRLGCDPQRDYRLLYKFASLGAKNARNVNSFKIGGPATTGLYQSWVDGFLKYVSKNNLRFDFYSWHRYSKDPKAFHKDINNLDRWLFKFGGYSLLPKLITEWGSDSENSSLHDGRFDAAHLVASMREVLGRVNSAFIFEIKDGPDPAGKKYWGRFGLLTNRKTGIEKKPKYRALEFLSKMRGNRLRVSGEGTWVKGIASKEGDRIYLILTNYDRRGVHSEKTPITFKNLKNGRYLYREVSLLGKRRILRKIISSNDYHTEALLAPNDLILIELSRFQ